MFALLIHRRRTRILPFRILFGGGRIKGGIVPGRGTLLTGDFVILSNFQDDVGKGTAGKRLMTISKAREHQLFQLHIHLLLQRFFTVVKVGEGQYQQHYSKEQKEEDHNTNFLFFHGLPFIL